MISPSGPWFNLPVLPHGGDRKQERGSYAYDLSIHKGYQSVTEPNRIPKFDKTLATPPQDWDELGKSKKGE